jgi:hypothetical protein
MSVVMMNDTDQDEIKGYSDHEEVQTINIDASKYKSDIKLSAVDYIESFFRDKHLANGSHIPSGLLYSEENISLVMNTRMAKGIDHFYTVFNDEFDIDACPAGPLPADIAFLMVVHRECAHRNIPKQYASGIAIIYLRLCAKLPRREMRMSA